MKILKDIAEILRRPFPIVESTLAYFKILLILSAFVASFLYIFQPFGIATLESDKFLICLGFGVMTFIGAAIYELLFHKIFKLRARQKKWTYGKWILDNLGIMIFISLANFLFIRLLVFGFIEWSLFPPMVYGTFMIGIIPLSALGAFMLFKNEKKYQTIADEINNTRTGPLNSQNAESSIIFDIPTTQIRFIEALQNYAKIGYISPEGSLKVQIERITLKRILSETEGTSIIRCHRSYLVNRDAIIDADGNAQGLLLSLSDCDTVIPVSRSHVPFFRG